MSLLALYFLGIAMWRNNFIKSSIQLSMDYALHSFFLRIARQQNCGLQNPTLGSKTGWVSYLHRDCSPQRRKAFGCFYHWNGGSICGGRGWGTALGTGLRPESKANGQIAS
jgi:hypothetical protein